MARRSGEVAGDGSVTREEEEQREGGEQGKEQGEGGSNGEEPRGALGKLQRVELVLAPPEAARGGDGDGDGRRL